MPSRCSAAQHTAAAQRGAARLAKGAPANLSLQLDLVPAQHPLRHVGGQAGGAQAGLRAGQPRPHGQAGFDVSQQRVVRQGGRPARPVVAGGRAGEGGSVLSGWRKMGSGWAHKHVLQAAAAPGQRGRAQCGGGGRCTGEVAVSQPWRGLSRRCTVSCPGEQQGARRWHERRLVCRASMATVYKGVD